MVFYTTAFMLCWEMQVADPDPGYGAFLTPGSGMGENQDPDPGSYFLELRNNFLG